MVVRDVLNIKWWCFYSFIVIKSVLILFENYYSCVIIDQETSEIFQVIYILP